MASLAKESLAHRTADFRSHLADINHVTLCARVGFGCRPRSWEYFSASDGRGSDEFRAIPGGRPTSSGERWSVQGRSWRNYLAAANAADDSAYFFGGGSGETGGAFFGRGGRFGRARFGRFCSADAGGGGRNFDHVIVDSAAFFVGIRWNDYPLFKDGATFDLATNFVIEWRPDRFCHTT
jgi:hypothetical protein